MDDIIYFNISEDYGEFMPVTLDDYYDMDEAFGIEGSEFETSYQYDTDVIIRLVDDPDNPFEVVAVGYDINEIDLLGDYSQLDNEYISNLPSRLASMVFDEIADALS